mgnify:CR=1 FL=1
MELSPAPFMLSYIWQQHCRIVAFSRCLIGKCRMTPLKIVSVDILSDGGSGFFDVIVLCLIGFFILEAAEPTLNHDVVCPAAFAIHTLPDSIFLYKINVLLACKLASLIGIQYLRFCHLECFFKALMTILVSSVSSTSQPTMHRLCQSITAVRYKKPRLIGIYVMSIDHA